MFSLALFQVNMLSPMVLAFFVGLLAIILKSDLKLPEGMYTGLSIYLLMSLGLKGGVSLNQACVTEISQPIVATLALGFFLPAIAFYAARFFGKMNISDAAALAAHYGSVSVVTFMAAQVFVESFQPSVCENYMVALVAIMEIPGIVVALLLATRALDKRTKITKQLRSIITGKSILLLIGGILIGYLTGNTGLKKIAPFFIDPFQGVLVLFMLDMGIVAGGKLKDVRKAGIFLPIFAVVIPILNAAIAIILGKWAGLSLSGTTVLAAMAASASYIAAPATVRIALPAANPGYYLTSAIAMTFPFNLTLGIPIYYMMASWYYS